MALYRIEDGAHWVNTHTHKNIHKLTYYTHKAHTHTLVHCTDGKAKRCTVHSTKNGAGFNLAYTHTYTHGHTHCCIPLTAKQSGVQYIAPRMEQVLTWHTHIYAWTQTLLHSMDAKASYSIVLRMVQMSTWRASRATHACTLLPSMAMREFSMCAVCTSVFMVHDVCLLSVCACKATHAFTLLLSMAMRELSMCGVCTSIFMDACMR
jgi:hypothetical protein